MPTITIQMYAGRTPAQKAHLVRAVTDAAVEALNVNADLVRITIVDVERYNSARGGVLAGG